jgi:endoglucanase
LNPDLQGMSSLDVMDKLIDGARQRNLRILLDRHRPTSAGQTDLWYIPTVPESTWIADWTDLARRYQDNDAVIGADISNEPRGPATWGSNDIATDWRLAAQRAGNAILAVNPRWLIFVEGVERYSQDWYWWGGNLMGVASAPVGLAIANRVVYSPHDYGPEVYPQGWFKDPTYPNNLPSVWDAHWGYIARNNIAPVVLGEFGGRSLGADAEGTWQRSLIAVPRGVRLVALSKRRVHHFAIQRRRRPNSAITFDVSVLVRGKPQSNPANCRLGNHRRVTRQAQGCATELRYSIGIHRGRL